MHTFTKLRVVHRLPLLLTIGAGLLCLVLSARTPACAFADSAEKAEKKEDTKKILSPDARVDLRIAVAGIRNRLNSKEIEGDISPPAELGEKLTEMLIAGLMNARRFVVLDSKPSDFSVESLLPGVTAVPDPHGAVKAAGNGAAYLITGFVTQYANKNDGGKMMVGGFTVGGKSATASLAVKLRVYDAATGKIVSVVDVRGSGVTHIHRDGCFGVGITRSDALVTAEQEAMNNAVKGICQEIEKAQAAKSAVSKPAVSPSAHPL